MKAKQIMLKKQGQGNKPNAAKPLTENEEGLLWSNELMGSSSPEALLNTLWYLNTLHFGMRSRAEHYEMQWGDVKLQIDSEGNEFLEYNERQTKTRTGVNPRDTRAFMPKAFANKADPSKCPVQLYKEFTRRRPESFTGPDTPFYLGINHKRGEKGCWFKKKTVGINTLGGIFKNMAKSAGIEKKITNHSARKTMASRLLDKGVDSKFVKDLGGWKNINSLDSYATASTSKQCEMSQLLHLDVTGESEENFQSAEVTLPINLQDETNLTSTTKETSNENPNDAPRVITLEDIVGK